VKQLLEAADASGITLRDDLSLDLQ
jgi:hypothetical protein